MTTLYLDRKNLELRLDGAALAFYENGQRRGTVPIGLLKRVVARGSTLISTSVLGALAESGVGFCVLSGRKGDRIAILLGRPHNDINRRLAQYKLALDADRKADIAIKIVRAKLCSCQSLLSRARNQRADLGGELQTAIESLERLILRLEPAALVDVPVLRGIEGAGARAYFRAFAKLFPPSLAFTTRNRRPPRDPVNACLSLVYTLLHFEAVLAAHMAGLDPLLGIYHGPAFGRESLASDFVDPLRAHVDEWVWNLFRERTLTTDHFRMHDGACLLGKAGRKHFYEGWEIKAKGLRRLLRITAGALARQLADEAVDFELKPEEDLDDESFIS